MSKARALTVGDADEQQRFWRRVVSGPAATDCSVWCGALADDGYGRFWIVRDGKERVVRPHRYALALALGRPLEPGDIAMHGCDNPVCVRATPETLGVSASRHVVVGTQAHNLAEMGAKGRGGGRGQTWLWYGPDRAARAARSRAVREAVRDGWDADRVAEALRVTHPGQGALF